MKPPVTESVAFDIYGTLIDTGGISAMLEPDMGEQATLFAQLWRQKQLEYSFRRGLMRHYRDFSLCTAQALDYAALSFGLTLSEERREQLLAAYRKLPAFDDVVEGLNSAKAAGVRLYAFSNGTAPDIAQLLEHAGISHYFQDIISVDEVHSFKPDPAVYRHFLNRSASKNHEAWLVSANPFDVIGAATVGMQSIWLQRTPQSIMDPWEIGATLTINRLTEIGSAITDWRERQRSGTLPP